MSLENKAAIVTGSDSGIGPGDRDRARPTRRGGHDQLPQERRRGGGRQAGDRDRRREGACRPGGRLERRRHPALVDETVKAFGRLDILVNNAGMETRTSTLDTTEHQFDMVIAIDLKSASSGSSWPRSR